MNSRQRDRRGMVIFDHYMASKKIVPPSSPKNLDPNLLLQI